MLCAQINLMPKAVGPWGSSQITLGYSGAGLESPPRPPCVCVCVCVLATCPHCVGFISTWAL